MRPPVSTTRLIALGFASEGNRGEIRIHTGAADHVLNGGQFGGGKAARDEQFRGKLVDSLLKESAGRVPKVSDAKPVYEAQKMKKTLGRYYAERRRAANLSERHRAVCTPASI